MKIHIVTIDSGWIIPRLAHELGVHAGYTVSQTARDDVDVNYYFDFQNAFKGRAGSGKQVAFFTHFHEDSAEYVRKNYLGQFKQLDGVVCMAKRYHSRLEDMFIMNGVKCQITAIKPCDPTLHFAQKKQKIGIFQRGGLGRAKETNTGHDGKGHGFMLEMIRLRSEILEKFEWHFVGQGWRQVVEALVQAKITVSWFEEPTPASVQISGTKITDAYERHLHDVDYVLVPSLWEGGPMIIPQAIAAGIPVISSDVGWANEFPGVSLYPPGNGEELEELLDGIVGPVQYRERMERLNWLAYKKALETFCGNL